MFEKEAEEYANNEINKMFIDESEEVYVRASTVKQIIKNSYLKGFAEGTKNIIKEDINAGNSPFDADKVFKKEMKAYTDET